MNTCHVVSIRFGLVLSLMMVSFQVALGAPGDQATKAGASAQPFQAAGTAAAGAVEDSLKACLARIPKEATAGQRMIAEQSCQRDETGRRAIDAVPGR